MQPGQGRPPTSPATPERSLGAARRTRMSGSSMTCSSSARMAAPLLERPGSPGGAEAGLEHSPPEDAVSCGAFPAPRFSRQDQASASAGPFVPPQPESIKRRRGAAVRKPLPL